MVKTFAGTLLLGLAALVAANAWPLPDSLANCLPPEYMAEAKMNHLAAQPPYDIVLFGNSRMHPARGAQVAPGRRVYNAAAGGTTFRAWVAMLEALGRSGRAPKVAVIAVDNVAFAQTGLAGRWPHGAARLPILADDAVALGRQPPDTREWNSFLHNRILVVEAQALLQWVNPRYAWLRLSLVLGLGHGCGGAAEDGSLTPTEPVADAPALMFRLDDLAAPLLERDLDRLQAVQARGTRVILYENPLIPELQPAIDPALPPRTRAVRSALFEGCRRRGLECHPQPLIPGSPANGYWPDHHHPPQRGLEAWVAGLVAPHLPGAPP